MAKPRDTFILATRRLSQPGREGHPAVPSFFPPLPKDAPANRLGTGGVALQARASAHRARGRQSLLAAVFRHRPGQDAEDFGSQGDAPVQRELLDWLATEFSERAGTSRRCSG